MDGNTWLYALAIVTLVIVAALAVITLWKKNSPGGNDQLDRVIDLVTNILEALKKECQGELRKLPISEVEAAATAVYRKFIARSPLLAAFIDEATFVLTVVDQWKDLVNIEDVVVTAVTLQRAMTESSSRASLN